jgi:hypothetical protein
MKREPKRRLKWAIDPKLADPRRRQEGNGRRGHEHSGIAGLTDEELGRALRLAARRGHPFVLAVFGFNVRASLRVEGFYSDNFGVSLFEANCPDYPTLDRAVAALAYEEKADLEPYSDGHLVIAAAAKEVAIREREDRALMRALDIAEEEEGSILNNLFSYRRAPAPDVGTDDKEAKQ